MSDNYELNSIKKDIIETRKEIKEKERELEKASTDEEILKYKIEIHKLKIQLNLQRKKYKQLKNQPSETVQNESLFNIILYSPPF